MCGAIRFAGLEADGAPGIAAQGHRRALTNLMPATRQGWLFLPALVLRPALMLLGLILGYFVFLAGIGLFNQVWLPQMRDASASGGRWRTAISVLSDVAKDVPAFGHAALAPVQGANVIRCGLVLGRPLCSDRL